MSPVTAACPRHPEAAAPEVCARCGDFLCEACQRPGPRGVQCPDCDAKTGGLSGIPAGLEATTGSILTRALEVFQAIFVRGFLLHLAAYGVMVAGLVAAALPVGIAVAVARKSPGAPTPALIGVFVLGGLLVLACLIACAWVQLRVQAAALLLARSGLHGEPLGIGAAVAASAGMAGPLVVAQLIIWLPVGFVGGLAMIPVVLAAATRTPLFLVGLIVTVPLVVAAAIVAFVLGSLAPPVVVHEGLPAIEAVRRGAALARANLGAVAGALLLAILGAIGVAMGAGLVLTIVGLVIPILPEILRFLIGIVTGLFVTSVVSCTYHAVRLREQG